MKEKIHYFPMDSWRCICSVKMIVGIVGVVFSLLLASGNFVAITVLDYYSTALYGVPFLLTMPFCAFSYADCFCDDLETKYINASLIRGGLKRYAFSKVIVTFISSVVTMIMGNCIYVLILHIRYPWYVGEESTYTTLINSGGFRYFLNNGQWMLYFSLVALQLGLLAGILSVFASYISLYISNKLLVISVPLIGYYLLYYYVSALAGDVVWFDLKCIFDATYGMKVCDNDLLAFLYAVFVAVVVVGGLYVAIYRKIRRKLERE